MLLEIPDPDLMKLPRRMAWGTLSLREIGVIVVISGGMPDPEDPASLAAQAERFNSHEFKATLASLLKQEVIVVTDQGKNLSVDLDSVIPPDHYFGE